MATGKAANIKPAPEFSLEKKVYNFVEKYSEYIPYNSERYRLAFCLYNYLLGKGDEPSIIVTTNKFKIKNISSNKFIELLTEDLNKEFNGSRVS